MMDVVMDFPAGRLVAHLKFCDTLTQSKQALHWLMIAYCIKYKLFHEARDCQWPKSSLRH